MSFKKGTGKCFARPPKFCNRMIMMLCGILMMGAGLSILREINLGTDPCSCFTQGVTKFVPLSFGTCHDWFWYNSKYVFSGIYIRLF